MQRQEQDRELKLEVEGLQKSFRLHNRGGIQVSGFRDIAFKVKKHHFLALCGPSGAGKSSILKTIYRTYLPGAGQMHLYREDGDIIDLACCSEAEVLRQRREEISIVTQFLKILPRVTALEVAAAPLIEKGRPANQAHREAADLLSFLGIRRNLFNLSPLTFSGGEQQRINIARAVIAPRPLILLDEPTASLDPESVQKVLFLLQTLKKRHIAMIGIFHDRNIREQISDDVYEVRAAS